MATCSSACAISESCVAGCVAELSPVPVKGEHVAAAVGLLFFSGLFSGLTLGLMSLDLRQLEIAIAGGDEEKKRQAERILPLRKRGNLLLCTLLLGNTLVNAGIAILTASFTGGVIGGLVSTGFILIFGEIIPQSVCSRYGLAAGSKTVDLVRLFLFVLFPVAWPLSKALDRLLGEELGTIYSRRELKELFAMQAKRAEEGKDKSGGAKGGAGTPGGEGIQMTEATFMCGALSLSERRAEQIMTRMGDVFGLYTDEKLDFPLMSRIYASGFTRIPIFKRVPHPTGEQALRAGLSERSTRHGEERGPMAAVAEAPAPRAAASPRGLATPPPRGVSPDAAEASAPMEEEGEAEWQRSGASGIPLMLDDGGGVRERQSSHPGAQSELGGQKEVVGLLSTKDLILVDPEDALSVEQLLAHCGRDVLRVWHDTPVNALFKDFTRGNSHLAFVQRLSEDAQSRQEFYELIGIVTLEDVLEELIQAEIVDESDVYEDNVSKRPVEEERSALQRRMAFNNMLDPRELHDTHLDEVEIAAVSSFLAANVEAFSPLLISAPALQHLLAKSTVRVARPGGPEGHPFENGVECDACTVVLHGRLHVVCGPEEFESDRGPWTVLGAPSLRQPHYVTDFTARVMEPSRLLQITKVDYDASLKEEAEALAAAVRAAAAEDAFGAGAALRSQGIRSSGIRGTPIARVACQLAPSLAHAYSAESSPARGSASKKAAP